MDEILKMFGGAENLWAAIQANAAKFGIEATKIMLELFYVLKSPETSMLNKSLIVAALGYQLLPEDAMPRDRFGLLGILDNGVTLAFAYNRVKSSVTPEIERQVNSILKSWFGGERLNDGYQECTPFSDRKNDNDSYHTQFIPQQPSKSSSLEDIIDSYHNKPQRPAWDDEDVVID